MAWFTERFAVFLIVAALVRLEVAVFQASPEKAARNPSAASGRVPATATKNTYAVQQREVSVCGKTYSSFDVTQGDARQEVVFEDVVLSEGGARAFAMLPARVVDVLGGHPRINNSGPTSLILSHPPLLIPRPTTSDTTMLRLYCNSLELADAIAQRLGYVSTPLISLEYQGAGWRAGVANSSEPPAHFTGAKVGATGPHPTELEHLILYSPLYAEEASRLANFHNTHGLTSTAVNVTTLPGIQPGSQVPAECEGQYRDECYYVPGQTHALVELPDEFVPTLYGMVNAVNAGVKTERIIDKAGIIRAAIRSYKRLYPSLRYVVLMGRPDDFPVRFSETEEVGAVIPRRNFSLQTDVYYSDVFTPWKPTNSVNYTAHSDLIWPNGQTSDPGNSDWNTTHFGWPVRFPFARTFISPSGVDITDETRTRLVGVGRIMGKVMQTTANPADRVEAPFGLVLKDPGVAAYINKLSLWNTTTKTFPSYASVEDGVYEKNNMDAAEAATGSLYVVGEGFGTGWSSNPTLPECQAYHPTTSDWHGTTGLSWYHYQRQPNYCKPRDMNLLSYNGVNYWPKPSPQELTYIARRTGFAFAVLAGHGGPVGISMNTDGFAGYPGRGFVVRELAGQLSDSAWSDLAPWRMGQLGGFVVSPACSTGGFSGGHASSIDWASKHKTLAEDYVTCDRCGGVGGWFNSQEGWYYSDPNYDGLLLGNYTAMQSTNPGLRAGDVSVKTMLDWMPNSGSSAQMSWQTLNRAYHGDPAALMPKHYSHGLGDPTE